LGLTQGLENLLNAACLAVESVSCLRIVLVGDGNQRATLQADAAGLTNVVTFLPPQADDTFPEVLAAPDTLLVNQRASVTDMSLPEKLTS